MIQVDHDANVHHIQMRNGENKVNLAFLDALNAALDEVEAAAEGPAAVLLSGEGKFFSSGLDLEFLMGASENDRARFGPRMMRTMRRLILFPTPVVAALNGHAFAAGAFIALACDFRVQREDRGWFCISEVDVGVPIGEPMMGLLRAKVPAASAREAALTGKRYPGPEARAAGFVDDVASEEKLVPTARALAATLATKERGIFRSIKAELYHEIAERFRIAAGD